MTDQPKESIEVRLVRMEGKLDSFIAELNRIRECDADCRAEKEERLDTIERSILGNGGAGLLERTRNLERQATERDEERRRLKGAFYALLGAVITQLVFQIPDAIRVLGALR